MTTTVQSLVTANAGTSASDLQPLLANDAFCSAANAELAILDRAIAATSALNDKTENLTAGIQTFAGAMGSLRAIAKRFPETSTQIAEAVKQVQSAMGVVKGNIPKESTATVTRTGDGSPTAGDTTWYPTPWYAPGNVVISNGVSYTCLVGNRNQAPPNPEFWTVTKA